MIMDWAKKSCDNNPAVAPGLTRNSISWSLDSSSKTSDELMAACLGGSNCQMSVPHIGIDVKDGGNGIVGHQPWAVSFTW